MSDKDPEITGVCIDIPTLIAERKKQKAMRENYRLMTENANKQLEQLGSPHRMHVPYEDLPKNNA